MKADVCCHITVLRRLMSYVWYQTSDVSCPISDIRRLMFGVWYRISDVNDVCYLISDISCQMSDITLQIWHQMSDNSYYDSRRLILYVVLYSLHLTLDIRHHIITVIRRLISDIISDMWYDIRCLISDKWHQTSDISYVTRLESDVWLQMSDKSYIT